MKKQRRQVFVRANSCLLFCLKSFIIIKLYYIFVAKNETVMEKFEFLKELRKKRGMTQQQVGILAGMSKSQLSRMEKGTLGSIETVTRILNALGYEAVVNFKDLRKTKKADMNSILETLRVYYLNNRDKLGIERIGLFGSYVRGEQRDDSDIDILITLKKPTLFLYSEIKDQLESVFHKKVDLISSKSHFKDSFKAQLEKEVRYVS